MAWTEVLGVEVTSDRVRVESREEVEVEMYMGVISIVDTLRAWGEGVWVERRGGEDNKIGDCSQADALQRRHLVHLLQSRAEAVRDVLQPSSPGSTWQ